MGVGSPLLVSVSRDHRTTGGQSRSGTHFPGPGCSLSVRSNTDPQCHVTPDTDRQSVSPELERRGLCAAALQFAGGVWRRFCFRCPTALPSVQTGHPEVRCPGQRLPLADNAPQIELGSEGELAPLATDCGRPAEEGPQRHDPLTACLQAWQASRESHDTGQVEFCEAAGIGDELRFNPIAVCLAGVTSDASRPCLAAMTRSAPLSFSTGPSDPDGLSRPPGSEAGRVGFRQVSTLAAHTGSWTVSYTNQIPGWGSMRERKTSAVAISVQRLRLPRHIGPRLTGASHPSECLKGNTNVEVPT